MRLPKKLCKIRHLASTCTEVWMHFTSDSAIGHMLLLFRIRTTMVANDPCLSSTVELRRASSACNEMFWGIEGLIMFEALQNAGILLRLIMKDVDTWGVEVCWYIIEDRYHWIRIVRSQMGILLYCTKRGEYGMSRWSCVHDESIHSRSILRRSACHCQPIIAYMIILYTESKHEQYNAQCTTHMRRSDKCISEVIRRSNSRWNWMLHENYILYVKNRFRKRWYIVRKNYLQQKLSILL